MLRWCTNFGKWALVSGAALGYILHNLASFQSILGARRRLSRHARFPLAPRQGDSERIGFDVATLVVAGWTGRDEAALRHHIEELAAIGVPRPSSVPVFYRNATLNVTQTSRLQVLGPDTSGEAEPVVVAHGGRLWLTVGSDHTDRKAETMGIALSKQLCGKPVGRELWLLDDVAGHWDQIKLRAFATIDGRRAAYQEGTLAGMRTPADLISRLGKPLVAGHRDVLRHAGRHRRHPPGQPL